MVKQPGSYTFAEVTAQTANKADWNRAKSRARITSHFGPIRGARTLACRVATLGDVPGREESRPGTHECVRHGRQQG